MKNQIIKDPSPPVLDYEFYKEWFEEILEEKSLISLASSVDNIPNNRILSYIYLKNENLILIQTDDSLKVKEFNKNKNVSFVTIPEKNETTYVRICNGYIKKSEKDITEVYKLFYKKYPEWYVEDSYYSRYGIIYEVHFSKVNICYAPFAGCEEIIEV